MGLNFAIPAATVEHLNIRRSGKEGDDIVAIDVKLSGTVEARALAPAAGAEPEDLINALWEEGGNEFQPKLLGVSELTTWGTFKNHLVAFGHASGVFGEIKKIAIKPIGGQATQADTVFTVTVDNPSDDLTNVLVDHIKSEVSVKVEAPPEFEFGGDE